MIDHTISYGRQYITDEDIQAVVEALKSDYLTQGPKINKFESVFAQFCNSKYACVVSNGTELCICVLWLWVLSPVIRLLLPQILL